MSTSNYKYTMVAAQAVSLAELFVSSFEQGLEGPVHFRVELSAPDGPSTAGGKQALQHVKLIPDGGGLAIVIGSADTTRQVAEIRTFDHIAALYAQRFRGAPIPIDAARYNDLGERLANFFRSMRMQVAFTELDPKAAGAMAPRAASGAAARSGSAWALAIGGGVLGLILIGAAYALLFLRH